VSAGVSFSGWGVALFEEICRGRCVREGVVGIAGETVLAKSMTDTLIAYSLFERSFEPFPASFFG
jgi:hypothetical protein